MIFQVSKIKQDVRVCIDQNVSSAPLVNDDDMDMLTLQDVIGSKILEAVELVHKAAPYWMLELGHNFSHNDGDDDSRRTIYWKGVDDTCGYLLLPDDFMRLVVFEMSDWERPVYEAISTDGPMYRRQHSRVKALRGTAQRPVVALGVKPEGKTLEFWSCKSRNATVTRAVYIPFPVVDANNGVDISERCYEAVVYMCAGLTMMSCGEGERAKNLMDLAKTLL